MPERIGVETIDDKSYCCMMRLDHFRARGKLGLKRYASAKHLLITPRGDPRRFVDEALADRGRTRTRALTGNPFTSPFRSSRTTK